MTNKKLIIIGLFLLAGIFLSLNVSAVDEPGVSFCCEKTIQGAWCQDANQSSCDLTNGLRASPSSCEATSYCKLGTCINGKAGDCMGNVPQKVCNDNGGTWSEKKADEIPQCQLGCCILGDQTSLVTQTQCKTLSSTYGLSTSFRADVKDQAGCFALANADVKGACVFEDNFEKTCVTSTKKECQQRNIDLPDANVAFHQGFLCSAEVLETNCGKSQKTTCVIGKDQVYFLDTCNNIANVYDATKANDVNYWTYLQDPSESCGLDSTTGNANSRTCGNCDYYLGSTCRDATKAGGSSPQIGTNICANLGCTYEGKPYKHGESWCSTGLGTGSTAINADNKRANVPSSSASLSGEGLKYNIKSSSSINVPGTQHYRLTCYDGEVTPELCSDYRNEVCMQSTIESKDVTFRNARCSVNNWQFCTEQPTQATCEDLEQRDCKWIETSWQPNQNGDQSKLIKKDADTGKYGACVPLYSPGYDFSGILNNTNSQQESSVLCSAGNVVCVIKYEKNLGGANKVVENVACAKNHPENIQWINELTNMCVSLGDCGATINYIGKESSSEIGLTYSGRK